MLKTALLMALLIATATSAFAQTAAIRSVILTLNPYELVQNRSPARTDSVEEAVLKLTQRACRG